MWNHESSREKKKKKESIILPRNSLNITEIDSSGHLFTFFPPGCMLFGCFPAGVANANAFSVQARYSWETGLGPGPGLGASCTSHPTQEPRDLGPSPAGSAFSFFLSFSRYAVSSPFYIESTDFEVPAANAILLNNATWAKQNASGGRPHLCPTGFQFMISGFWDRK